MPKEFLTFELNRASGTPWGIRIGGGVDRGKVLVLEKVRNTSKLLMVNNGTAKSLRSLV
jgi:hypothetical protein